jgi:hypothetical protein|nr:MAG TPA: hypothetical protein [Bacteriophage sp.]
MCHGSLYDPYGHHIGFVNNFYTELGSVQMNLELEDGRTFQFNPGDLLRDRQGDWRIRKPEESVLDSMRYMHWVDRVMEEAAKKKEETTMTAASIKNVIFNPPATIVFWTDGSKTVVKCNAKEEFDPEKGMAMAIAKRCANNSDDFYKEIKKWVEKSGYKQVDDMKALVKEIKRVYYDPAKEPMDLCAKIVALKILIDGLDAIVSK